MTSLPKIFIVLTLCTLYLVSCSDSSSYSQNEIGTTESATALPDTSIADERVIIKTANIAMDVDHVEETVQTFQALVNSMQGHVFHYEIENEKRIQNEVKQTLDSNLIVNEIHPTAMIKVRVPAEYGDTFISAVLKMDGGIANFLFDENDVTEDITEKKELMLNDASINIHKTKSIAQDAYESETKESFIKRKADFAKMKYQTKNLWFDIHLNGKTFTEKQMVASAKSIHTPFYVGAMEALNNGWYGLSLFITLLLNLWPLYAIAALLLIVLRKLKIFVPVVKK